MGERPLLAETGSSQHRFLSDLNVRYPPETGPSRDRLVNSRFVPMLLKKSVSRDHEKILAR